MQRSKTTLNRKVLVTQHSTVLYFWVRRQGIDAARNDRSAPVVQRVEIAVNFVPQELCLTIPAPKICILPT